MVVPSPALFDASTRLENEKKKKQAGRRARGGSGRACLWLSESARAEIFSFGTILQRGTAIAEDSLSHEPSVGVKPTIRFTGQGRGWIIGEIHATRGSVTRHPEPDPTHHSTICLADHHQIEIPANPVAPNAPYVDPSARGLAFSPVAESTSDRGAI